MPMTQTQQRLYREHALPLAAYLWAKGRALLGVVPDPQRPGHYVFEFTDDDGNATNDARDYYNGGVINARSFARSLAELKSMIHSKATMPQVQSMRRVM